MKRLLRTIILTAIFSIVIISVCTYNYRFNKLVKSLENIESNSYEFSCLISEFPIYDGNKIELYCDVLTTDCPIDITDYKVLVKVPSDNYDICAYGSKIKIFGNLKVASDDMNYGDFNYRNYLKSKNTVGIIDTKEEVHKLPSKEGLKEYIYKFRRKSIANIDKFFADDENALIKAIITGERADISDRMYDSYKKTGVYHIVSVSGLHVGIFISLIMQIMSYIKMKNRKKVLLTRVLSIFIAIAFFMFTGYGVSILRVIFMLIVLLISFIFRRKYNIIISIISSAVIIAFLFPYQVFSMSYQLSFMSTLGLCLALDIFKKRAKLLDENDYIATSVVISLGAFIATLHICSYNFGLISIASVVANIVIIPLSSFLLSWVIVFCAISFILPKWILEYVKLIPLAAAKLINKISLIFSSFDISYISVPSYFVIGATLIILSVTGVVIFLRHKKILFTAALSLIIIVNSCFLMYNINRYDKVVFINAGKGECTYVYSKGEHILIDCGSTSYESSAENIFIPYFNHNGIYKIDKLFISYFDKEHTNAITTLMSENRIREIVIPPEGNIKNENALLYRKRILYYADKYKIKTSKIDAENPVKISDRVKISIYTDDNVALKDKNSCPVYEVLCGKTSFILSSCIGEKGQELLSKKGTDCDVLKIPSYGNMTKSTKEYVMAFSPEYAVVTTPENDRYFKFDENIIKVLNDSNIKYARTDMNKTITFLTDGEKIKSVFAYKGELN